MSKEKKIVVTVTKELAAAMAADLAKREQEGRTATMTESFRDALAIGLRKMGYLKNDVAEVEFPPRKFIARLTPAHERAVFNEITKRSEVGKTATITEVCRDALSIGYVELGYFPKG